jgi:SAM-dependent methyltransferase
MQDNSKYFVQERNEILSLVKPDIKIVLDVGCASGYFGGKLKAKYGCAVWGVEPIRDVSELAESKIDKVYNDLFTDRLDFGGQKFDAIFFNDVLEHINEPLDALLTAKKHLTSNGVVYASIPNFLFFNNIYPMVKNRDWIYEDAGILDRTHIRFFTRKSMIRLFEEAGYRVEEIHGINPTWTKKFLFLCRLFPGILNDFKFLQFFIKASPVDKR